MSGIPLGPLTLSYFSLLVLGGVVAGAAATALFVAQKGEPTSPILDMVLLGLALGLVLSRLFYVLNPPPAVAAVYDAGWFLRHPLDFQFGIIAVWTGGLGRAGALLGALLAVGFVLWRQKLDVAHWRGPLAVGFAVALVIMPWANVVNGQLLGPPLAAPWAIMGRHPLPAYVSIWALSALALVLWQRQTCPLLPAMLIAGLLVIDFFRVDVARPLLGLTGLQLLLLGMILWEIRSISPLRIAPHSGYGEGAGGGND